MPRIAWIEDSEAQGDLAILLAEHRARTGRPLPDILRTMSQRPDFLAPILQATKRLHYSDGALTRAQREMIASYVAALNRCQYCVSSHSWFLQLQGVKYSDTARALADGELDRAPVTHAERLLLEFVGTLTRHAYRVTDEQVEQLRHAGWTDPQIAEATYDAALFNMYVRLADAFGLQALPEMGTEDTPAARSSG